MKRMIAAALAAVLVATSAPAVGNAANLTAREAVASAISVQESDQKKLDDGKTVTVDDKKTGVTESVKKTKKGITVKSVKSSKKTVKIAGTVNSTKVNEISASAFKNCSKAKTIDLTDVELTKLNKNQFKGTKAKTVKINATKLTAKSINKKALKGCKAKTIKLTCTSKKQYNELVKKLKKSAPKGTKFKLVKAKGFKK